MEDDWCVWKTSVKDTAKAAGQGATGHQSWAAQGDFLL